MKVLEARLRRLEDLEEIHHLLVDYGHHLDAADLDAYVELFADDGELLLGPVARATGPAEIKTVMSKALAGAKGNSYHVISSPTSCARGRHRDRPRRCGPWSSAVTTASRMSG